MSWVTSIGWLPWFERARRRDAIEQIEQNRAADAALSDPTAISVPLGFGSAYSRHRKGGPVWASDHRTLPHDSEDSEHSRPEWRQSEHLKFVRTSDPRRVRVISVVSLAHRLKAMKPSRCRAARICRTAVGCRRRCQHAQGTSRLANPDPASLLQGRRRDVAHSGPRSLLHLWRRNSSPSRPPDHLCTCKKVRHWTLPWRRQALAIPLAETRARRRPRAAQSPWQCRRSYCAWRSW